MPEPSLKVFTGNANPTLAQAVAKELGISLGEILVGDSATGKLGFKFTRMFVALMSSSFSRHAHLSTKT